MSNNKKGKLNNTISQAKPVDAPVDAKTKEKKVLFRLIDFTKHFPLKKTSVFQKEGLSVLAIDGRDLEIYEGETLGLVGESGCGKSITSRSILQLIDDLFFCCICLLEVSFSTMVMKITQKGLIFQN